MIRIKNFLIVISIFVFFYSCKDPSDQQKSGIVLTFDDYFIDNWLKADSIFSKYHWKATFCVSKFPELSKKIKKKLLILQNNGNEIAFHGTHHERASFYIQKNTLQNYIDYEITPGLKEMEDYGLDISSFAYPGGVRDGLTDKILLNYFSVLRGTTYNALPPSQHNCFINCDKNSNLVFAIGIDSHYEHFSIEYIESLLDYAKDEDKIIVFYGHSIEDKENKEYVTSYNTLTKICDFAVKNDLKFYTLSDLNKLDIN